MNLDSLRGKSTALPVLKSAGVEVRAVSGNDGAGLALEVLTVDWVGRNQPTTEALRRIHSERAGKKVYPLVVATEARDQVWLFGPNPDAAVVGPLDAGVALRILQTALDEPNGVAARSRLAHLQRSLSSSDLPGVTNQGLFASHYLTGTGGVRSNPKWNVAKQQAAPWLRLRDDPLISALGFSARRVAANASLLSSGSSRGRAVAVLLRETETFDAESPRFSVSPVAYGLSVAMKEEVPWLLVLRGSQIRLYPSNPDVGVGRRGQADTYFELDLALISDDLSGYLALVFSASALAPNGTTEEILKASGRYAAELGVRLRDRVYKEVVPQLSVAVANQVAVLRPSEADNLSLSYRLTLRVLFRLLFQAYAEDQGLLPYQRNPRYDRNALKTYAMDLASDPGMAFDPDSQAMWDDLVQVWRVIDSGDAAWDVPAYDGGLFGADPKLYPEGALIEDLRLSNAVMGHVLRHLLVDLTSDGSAGAVDFRSLSVREFGTIYEGLLESSVSRAEADLVLDPNEAYVPAALGDIPSVNTGQVYFHNRSGERKATGSYFTPSFAVEHLLERALDPTLERHLQQVGRLLDRKDEAGAVERFFDFRVGDLAMGSGHFLVAAIDHIEARFNAFLAEHPIPAVLDEIHRLEQVAQEALGDAHADYEIEASGLLRRQIARRCIYGLDVNPIAVELAQVAVWIHTFVPGLPMSNLSHNLVCANSLTGIGTIEEAIESLEGSSSTGQISVFLQPIQEQLEEARSLLVNVANAGEANKAEVRRSAEILKRAQEAARPTKLLFDAGVAQRTGILPPELLLDVEQRRAAATDPQVQAALATINPGHLPYLFPEVFLRDNGGFDVLIGNPPWEKIKVEEHAWWGMRSPGLRGLPQREKNARIQRLRSERVDLVEQYEKEVEQTDRMRRMIASGPYPGIGRGDIDLYQAFAWRNWQLLRSGGAIGILLPRGALSGSGTVEWRRRIFENASFRDICMLTNTGNWAFENVDGRYTVALVGVDKAPATTLRFGGPFYSEAEYREGRDDLMTVEVEEFRTWSNSLAFPAIPDAKAGEIMRQMKTHPNFESRDSFEFRPTAELHATGDRSLFDVTADRGEIPVLAGASFNLWTPDFGPPYAYAKREELVTHLLSKARNSATLARSAFHGLKIGDERDLPISRARIAFRDVARASDQRTALFGLLPPGVAFVHNAPYLLRVNGDEQDEAYLLGIVSSLPFDWYARRWVEIHLTFQILSPMPMPRPDRNHPLRRRIVDLASRLAAVDDRYASWAEVVGAPIGTLLHKPERSGAVFEIDALVALLYELSEDQLEHIFKTFHRGWNYKDRWENVRSHYRVWRDRA